MHVVCWAICSLSTTQQGGTVFGINQGAIMPFHALIPIAVDEELCLNGATEVLCDGLQIALMCCIVTMGRQLAKMFNTFSL